MSHNKWVGGFREISALGKKDGLGIASAGKREAHGEEEGRRKVSSHLAIRKTCHQPPCHPLRSPHHHQPATS